jgi:pyruvate-formate lyase
MLKQLNNYKKERVQRIKKHLIGTPPGICSERLRYYTETYKEHESKPAILKRGIALSEYLKNVTLYYDQNTLQYSQNTHGNGSMTNWIVSIKERMTSLRLLLKLSKN